jgi:integrase
MAKFKRGGIWYGRVKNHLGKWVPKTLNTRDPKVADVRYRELERREADPSYKAANETTLHAAGDAFETSRRVKGCADGTMHMYGVKLGHLERLLGADTPLARLEPPGGSALVDKFIATRLAEGAARNTIGKELTTLRGLLKVAKRAGKFSGDLDAVLPEGWSNDYEPRRTALTPAQVAALVQALAAPRRWTDSLGREYTRDDTAAQWLNHAAMVAFIVATGFRLGEARRAVRGQIDLARGLVYCAITKTRKKGKREKWVPITPVSRPLLEQVLAATAGRGAGKMFDPWANVIRDLGIVGMQVPGLPTRLSQGREVAWVTPNDLRRTHANWLRDAGVDTSTIADVLGHVDSRQVERVYGKLRPDQLRDRVLVHVH